LGPRRDNRAAPPATAPSESAFLPAHLVVVLHQQHPAADGRSGPTVVEGVRRYRDRLAGVCADRSEFDAPVQGLGGLRLFEPTVAALAGGYDFATLYLSDDVACIDQLAAQHGTVAQETLFGPLHADLTATEQRLLHRLLAPSEDAPAAGLLVASLKLGDHLLALDSEAVVAALRRDVLLQVTPSLDLLVLRCWSWPELLVLAASPDLAALRALAAHLEHRPIDALQGEPPLVATLASPQGHAVPDALLRTWVHGRQHAGALDVASLGQRDLAVVERCQLGLLPAAQVAVDSAWAVQAVALDGEAAQPRTDAADGFLPGAAIVADSATHPLIARIRLAAKPGHQGDVARHADALRDTWPLRAPEPRLHQARNGRRTTLSLDLPIPPTVDGLAEALATGLWLRHDDRAGPHLLDVSTALLDQPPLHAAAHAAPGPGGYALLDATWGPEHIAWFHERAGLARLGATSARSLHNLLGTIRASAGRHDMFGAMLDLVDLRRYVLHRLTDERLPWLCMARDVDDWVAFGTAAWHQRIEQSAALRGGPRLQGQLPYGITQLVTMLGGLAGALHGLVDHALPQRPGSFDPERHRPAIVVLTSDDSVQVKLSGGVPIFRVGAAAATSVPHLVVLFHELGHILFRRLFEDELGAWDTDVRALARTAVQARLRVVQDGVAAPRPELLLPRFISMLGDVLANATWRRLGCESIDQFERHLELAQAMGMRDDNLRERRSQAEEAWAETLVHLRLQRELEDNGEHLGRALIATARAVMDRDAWREWARAHEHAWSAELTQPDPGEAEPPTAATVTESLRMLACDHATLLTIWASTTGAAVTRRATACLDALAGLEEKLAQAETELSGSDYQALASEISGGRPGTSPPWSCVDADRETPSLHAFLWARRVLTTAVDAMVGPDSRPAGASLGIRRDAANRSRGPGGGTTLEPGAWADHRGRLFLVGRAARARHVQVQAAALTALGALGWRVRAGSLRRFLGHARDFPRTALDGDRRARLSGPEGPLSVPLCDSSPIAVGCLGTPPPGPLELAVPLSSRQAATAAAHLHDGARLEDEADRFVLWVPVTAIPHADTTRFGLKLPSTALLRALPDVFARPTWAAVPVPSTPGSHSTASPP